MIEERAPGRPGLVTDVGVRLPAHLTASGLAMLAALPAPQVDALFPPRRALVRRHDAGPASLTELRALLVAARRDRLRRRGRLRHARVRLGRGAVLDHTGHPIAAVAVTFPADEVDAGGAGRARPPGRRRGAGRVAGHIRGRTAEAAARRAA